MKIFIQLRVGDQTIQEQQRGAAAGRPDGAAAGGPNSTARARAYLDCARWIAGRFGRGRRPGRHAVAGLEEGLWGPAGALRVCLVVAQSAAAGSHYGAPGRAARSGRIGQRHVGRRGGARTCFTSSGVR